MNPRICAQCEREVDVTEFFGTAGCVNHPCGCKGHEPVLMTKPKYDFELFGRKVWELIQSLTGDLYDKELQEYILPLAQEARLCERVKYDPAKHGDMDFEPGDEIWFWGEEKK